MPRRRLCRSTSPGTNPAGITSDDLAYDQDKQQWYRFDGTSLVSITDFELFELILDIRTKEVLGVTSDAKYIAKGTHTAKLYNLGTPVVADIDRIVTTTNMKVGTYTIAAQPDVARNITVTATAGGTADTMGKITVAGTNSDGVSISEEIIPVAGSTVVGAKAFKTVTSVTGSGWVINGTTPVNDTIVVGVGAVLGLPIALSAATQIVMGILGTAIVAHTPVVTNPVTLCGTTIDMSSGTYNGSKAALIFAVNE